MNQTDYEYRGAMATYWDLLRGDTSQWADKFFYLDMIAESGQPVLDVGCGTGRLLLDYLASGIEVEGVDNSPEMLSLCRQKAERLDLQPVLYQQSMERLDLPRRYRTILVPSSSFQLLTDLADAQEAMRRFRVHLEPGGRLVMPFMVLAPGEKESEVVEEDWQLIAERVRPEDEALVRHWGRSRYELANQLEHTENRYEVVLDGELVSTEFHARSPATRWYTQAQAVDLYRQAGFKQVQLFKEFSRQPASPEDQLFTAVGSRP